MYDMKCGGAIAFTDDDRFINDSGVMLRAMQYAATFDYRVWLRPQDSFLAKNGVAHDGEVATRLGLPSIPVIAETIALATALQLARETGVIPAALAGLLLGMKAPGAQMIASVTFIAILMTILIQAPTTKWLGEKLGLLDESPG